MDNSLNIHHGNLQRTVTEILQVKNGLSTELVKDFFKFTQKPYSLQMLHTPNHSRISGVRGPLQQNMT